MTLTENALTVLKARYMLGDETPGQLFDRVSRAIALAEDPSERTFWQDRFYRVLSETVFLPNSPLLFNAGTARQGTFAACFVLPVADSLESVMATAGTLAKVQKHGGGVGCSFSSLREKGSPISRTQGQACGPVSVLRMYSSIAQTVIQGGRRPGANMGILDIGHPDVLDFIDMKEDNIAVPNFNISVAIPDDFMYALENGLSWDLVSPSSKRVVKRVAAQEVWNRLIQSAWRTGDPGVFFIDEANRHNPTPHLGRLESTNPCGEVPLLSNESCNLGSIDLGKLVVHGNSKAIAAKLDYDRLIEAVRIAVRFLDNAISLDELLTEQIREATLLTRKVGLGVMGWHHALMKMGIPYDSNEAISLASKVMDVVSSAAKQASSELARERGSYPALSGGHPVRNATRTCIAPTGSISIIAGTSGGIEPVFALAYTRSALNGKQLIEIDPHFIDFAEREGFYSEDLMQELLETGSCQALSRVPPRGKLIYKTALEIGYQTHIRMQAAFQSKTDLAVSKTINMSDQATPADISDAFLFAYRSKCKGVTVYRNGSKPAQVLNVKRPFSSRLPVNPPDSARQFTVSDYDTGSHRSLDCVDCG